MEECLIDSSLELWDPSQNILQIKTINKKVSNTKQGKVSFVTSIFNLKPYLSPNRAEMGYTRQFELNID